MDARMDTLSLTPSGIALAELGLKIYTTLIEIITGAKDANESTRDFYNVLRLSLSTLLDAIEIFTSRHEELRQKMIFPEEDRIWNNLQESLTGWYRDSVKFQEDISDLAKGLGPKRHADWIEAIPLQFRLDHKALVMIQFQKNIAEHTHKLSLSLSTMNILMQMEDDELMAKLSSELARIEQNADSNELFVSANADSKNIAQRQNRHQELIPDGRMRFTTERSIQKFAELEEHNAQGLSDIETDLRDEYLDTGRDSSTKGLSFPIGRDNREPKPVLGQPGSTEEDEEADFSCPMPREVLTALIDNYERQVRRSSSIERFDIAQEHQRHIIRYAEEWNTFYEPHRDISRIKQRLARFLMIQASTKKLIESKQILQEALLSRRQDRQEIHGSSSTYDNSTRSDLNKQVILNRSESFLDLAEELYQRYLNGERPRALYQSYLYAKESFKYRFPLRYLPDSGFQRSVKLLVRITSHLDRPVEAETYHNMFSQTSKLPSTPSPETSEFLHSPHSLWSQLPHSSRQSNFQSQQQVSSLPTWVPDWTLASHHFFDIANDLYAISGMTHRWISTPLMAAILSGLFKSVPLNFLPSQDPILVLELMRAADADFDMSVIKSQNWDADSDRHEQPAIRRSECYDTISLITMTGYYSALIFLFVADIEEMYHADKWQQEGPVQRSIMPLTLAARRWFPMVMNNLLKRGSNFDITDANELTALQVAVAYKAYERQSGKCESILRLVGANPNLKRAEIWHTSSDDTLFVWELALRSLLEVVSVADLKAEDRFEQAAVARMTSIELSELLKMFLQKGTQTSKLEQWSRQRSLYPVPDATLIERIRRERSIHAIMHGDLRIEKRTKHKTGDHMPAPKFAVKGHEAGGETKYIVPTNVDGAYPKQFVYELTSYLSDGLERGLLNLHLVDRICNVLGNLLKDFALTFALNAQTQLERDVVYYVYKYRSVIVENFRKKILLKNTDDGFREPFGSRADPEVSNEYILDWVDRQGDAGNNEKMDYTAGDVDATKENPLVNEHEALILPNLCSVATGSAAYQWLVTALKKELLLDTENSSSTEMIREMVHSCLPDPSNINRAEEVKPHGMIISVEWDPRRFISEQEYQENSQVAIETAITLTGSTDYGQALTSTQYMCQTWPRTGKQILRLVSNVGTGPDDEKHTCNLVDGTKVTAWLGIMSLNLDVCGSRASISEVAEQFIWLAAALRSSPFDDGVACCRPVVYRTPSDGLDKPKTHPTLRCKFDLRLAGRHEGLSSNGKCWYGMFRDPVLVEGFPILRRSTETMGLEMPLNMMAALVDTRRLDEYNGKLFVKGFSAMLIPTRRLGELLLWHVLYTEDGTHISYSDAATNLAMPGISEVEYMRHIVGWCPEADFLAGDPEANYNVKRADLPSPSADCVLQNVSISCGKIITGGGSIAIGNKDKPIRVTKGGYMPKLEWIHEKFFVFWDERTKRGWLVNGSSALLHLLRAALKRKESGPFRSLLLYKAGSILEAAERRTTESAIQVLANKDNLRLKIYFDRTEIDEKTVRKGTGDPELISEEKDSFFYMQDLVEEIYNVLEKMIEHQADVASKNGVSLKCRFRKHIDGWSFNDIIENRDCKPGVVTLQSRSTGWVDLLGDLGAITLYGEDFGELIRPTNTEKHCAQWSQMPSGNYFLAACISDLVGIIGADRDSTAEPMKITSNLSWQNWDKRFEPCQCSETGQLRHSNLAQRLQSSNNKYHARSKGGPLEPHGAVIFSHNTELTFWRGEDVAPSRPKPLRSPDTTESEFRDSGLGSSQAQSSGEDSIESSSSSLQSHTDTQNSPMHEELHESQDGEDTTRPTLASDSGRNAQSTTPRDLVSNQSSSSQGLSDEHSPQELRSRGLASSESPRRRIKSRLPRFKRSFLKQS